jgi:hypothetical protein
MGCFCSLIFSPRSRSKASNSVTAPVGVSAVGADSPDPDCTEGVALDGGSNWPRATAGGQVKAKS